MLEKLILNTNVSYADVDRREVMLLPRIFKLLQEAAIMHANQFGTGTRAVAVREESWVLNRVAASIARYPRHDEPLVVETWSTGINGFKGFRDFRVFDAQRQPVIHASSVWAYISVKTKSIVRVPAGVAESFPRGAEPAWCPELERLSFRVPAATASAVPVDVRYSDFDANEHVNNAAYLDFVQTALARAGCITHPRRVQLKYAKAIGADVERVEVRLEPLGTKTRFSVEADGTAFALGETEE